MTSFLKDIAAAADAFGPDKIGLIFGVAMTPWESDDQRDRFLEEVTRASEE